MGCSGPYYYYFFFISVLIFVNVTDLKQEFLLHQALTKQLGLKDESKHPRLYFLRKKLLELKMPVFVKTNVFYIFVDFSFCTDWKA